MQSSQIPYKFQEVWAAAAAVGYINSPIPDTSTGANASQHLGFPPITATPIGSGGIPPNIGDFNGVFSYLSAWARWLQAGAPVAWDSTFSTNIGGYPQGAIVQSATTLGLRWLSTADNNTTNPDTGGANWVSFPPSGIQVYNTVGTFTYTVPAFVSEIIVEVWGGGGGGSSNTASTSGEAGAAGAYGFKRISTTPGATFTVVIAAVALGGPSGTGGFGQAGGSCSFGSLSVAGGAGGAPGTGGASAGGAAPTGFDIAMQGGDSPGQGFASTTPIGKGGDAPRGGGGGVSSNTLGQPGHWPGGGGGAGMSTTTSPGGGSGAAGGVIVRWGFPI